MSTVDVDNDLYAALGLSREIETKKSNQLELEVNRFTL